MTLNLQGKHYYYLKNYDAEPCYRYFLHDKNEYDFFEEYPFDQDKQFKPFYLRYLDHQLHNDTFSFIFLMEEVMKQLFLLSYLFHTYFEFLIYSRLLNICRLGFSLRLMLSRRFPLSLFSTSRHLNIYCLNIICPFFFFKANVICQKNAERYQQQSKLPQFHQKKSSHFLIIIKL